MAKRRVVRTPRVKAKAAPRVSVKTKRTPKSVLPSKLTFGEAIQHAKAGAKIARDGWNGKGMWVIYVPGTKKAELKPDTPYAKALGKRKFIDILPHFDMFTANRQMLPGWLASQSDMDATDWCVVK